MKKTNHKDKAGCAVFDKNEFFVCISQQLHEWWVFSVSFIIFLSQCAC